jgi:hypothetical protein
LKEIKALKRFRYPINSNVVTSRVRPKIKALSDLCRKDWVISLTICTIGVEFHDIGGGRYQLEKTNIKIINKLDTTRVIAYQVGDPEKK